MCSGLDLPANLNSSSRRNDYRIASVEKEKIERNYAQITSEMKQLTKMTGTGEFICKSYSVRKP